MHFQIRMHTFVLVCAVVGACNGGGGGPGGGSEQVGGGSAAILIGGPGGGSSTLEVDPAESDRIPSNSDTCPDRVVRWDRQLHEGDFTAVLEETGPEIEGTETQTLALLYNSLGRLYSSEEPARVLADLDRVALDHQGLTFCGLRGPALHAEGSMFAHAALGNLVEARRELSVIGQIAPAATSELLVQLDRFQEVVESPPNLSESPTEPSPVTTPSPIPSQTGT